MTSVNYALQVCDIANNQDITRFCSNSKTEITIKCVTSFLWSIRYAAIQKPDSFHNVIIFSDKSTDTTNDFLLRAQAYFTSSNIKITVAKITSTGIMDSIRTCWQWLSDQEDGLVFQVQDDYLFTEDAVYQAIDIFFQLLEHTQTHCIVTPFNDPHNWYCKDYHYQPTPRMVVAGIRQYWIQTFDITCSFLTSKIQFDTHWDMYEKFLSLDPRGGDGVLENVSLNRIVVDRTVLGLQPFTSLSLHMQTELEKDPYIDWQARWDAVPVI